MVRTGRLIRSIAAMFAAPTKVRGALNLHFIVNVIVDLIMKTIVVNNVQHVSIVSTGVIPVVIAYCVLLIFIVLYLGFSGLPKILTSVFRSTFDLRTNVNKVLKATLANTHHTTCIGRTNMNATSVVRNTSHGSGPVHRKLMTVVKPTVSSKLIYALATFPVLVTKGCTSRKNVGNLCVTLGSFRRLLPNCKRCLLVIVIFFFTFSAVFSCSCCKLGYAGFLFNTRGTGCCGCFCLIVVIITTVVPLKTIITVVSLTFTLVTLPAVASLLLLTPQIEEGVGRCFTG